MGFFDTSWLGPAISAGASHINNMYGDLRARKQADKEMANNFLIMQYQNAYNTQERLAVQNYEEEMYNKYMTPEAQLRLAVEAGINPNSVIGGGYSPATSNPMSSSPQSSASMNNYGSLPAAILQNSAQMSNILANARLTDAEARLKENEASFGEATFDERLRQYQLQGDKLFADLEGVKIDNQVKQDTYRWFAEKSKIELQTMSEQLNVLRNEAILKGILIDTEKLNQDKIRADIDETRANIDNIKANTANINQETENLKKQGEILDYQAEQEKLKVDFSQVTKIPFGTQMFEVQYALWKQGKWAELADISLITADDITDVGISRFILNNKDKGKPDRSLLNRVTSLDEGIISRGELRSAGTLLLRILGLMIKNSGEYNIK